MYIVQSRHLNLRGKKMGTEIESENIFFQCIFKIFFVFKILTIHGKSNIFYFFDLYSPKTCIFSEKMPPFSSF